MPRPSWASTRGRRRPAEDGDRHRQGETGRPVGGVPRRAAGARRHRAIESKDQRDSAFSLDTFSDKTFVITTSGSSVLLILSTVLSIFQTVLKTVTLDVRQWLICTAVALSIVAAAEIRKAVRRRTAAT
jgi:hypothetical protein